MNNIYIKKLSTDYRQKFFDKIKNAFNDREQLLVTNFYDYLNYNYKNDFVVNLDNVYKWISKDQCENVVINYFTLDVDYKIKENDTLLSVNAFKKLCLRVNTKQSEEIYDLYTKLEEILHDILDEELNDLRFEMNRINHLKNTRCYHYNIKDGEYRYI